MEKPGCNRPPLGLSALLVALLPLGTADVAAEARPPFFFLSAAAACSDEMPSLSWRTRRMVVTAAALREFVHPDPQPKVAPPSRIWRRKLRYAAVETVDPLSIVEAAGKAGVYQATGFRRVYGTGVIAYSKQFGAVVTNAALRNMMRDFVFAALTHEDPRYVLKKDGGVAPRTWYATSRVFVTHSDEGRPVFNWSSVLGSAASAGMANLYLPSHDHAGRTTAFNVGWFLLGSAGNNIFHEFLPTMYGRLSKR